MRVYRWDLDKTYLATDFESLRGLVRSATESAADKRALPGAAPLLRALGQAPEARVYIVSGSPSQMREKLEEKLRLDGIRYEHLALKDTVGHLRKGQMRAIKGQFGYKLPNLLRGRAGMGRAVRECLFGDDVEVDALVYSVYADVVAGRVDRGTLARVLTAAGAYPEAIDQTLDRLRKVSTAEAVERIFIRVERGVPMRQFDALGPRVVPVHSWLQAALVLADSAHIDPHAVGDVLAEVMGHTGYVPWSIAALVQDIVRRGHLRAGVLDSVPVPDDLRRAWDLALQRLGPVGWRPPAPPTAAPDYVALVKIWQAKE